MCLAVAISIGSLVILLRNRLLPSSEFASVIVKFLLLNCSLQLNHNNSELMDAVNPLVACKNISVYMLVHPRVQAHSGAIQVDRIAKNNTKLHVTCIATVSGKF